MRHVPLQDGEVDLALARVRRGTRLARLTGSELTLLEALAARPGEAMERDDLQALGFSSARAVDQAVFRLRAKLEVDPKQPVHLLTVFNVGYRLVPAESRVAAPLLGVGPARDSLIGREGLVAEADRAARASPTARVLLVGPAGVGKSRVAAEVARRAAATWARGGAWRVDCSCCRDAGAVAEALAETVGVRDLQGVDAARAASRVLEARQPVLAILDDVDLAADDLKPVLEAVQVPLILTCRSPVEGLPALAVPPLSEDDAVALFLARAEALRPLAGEERNPQVLRRIAAGTDGLPLAIELAAQRLRSLDVAAVARALDHQLKLLRRPGSGRHASMAATLAWTWDSLGATERDALAQASVFASWFDAEAAEAVVQPGGTEAVRALVRLGLAREDEGRLALLRAVRAWVSARVDPSTLRDARARHASVFVALADRVTRPADEGYDRVFASISAAREDLESALALTDDPRAKAAITLALCQLQRGHAELDFDTLIDALEPSLERVLLRIQRLWRDALHVGDIERAHTEAVEAVDEARAIREVDALLNALRSLAACEVRLGRFEAAEAAAREAVAEAGPTARRRSIALGTLGAALITAGRVEEAMPVQAEVARLAEACGSAMTPGWLGNLGVLRSRAGDAEGAREAWERSLAVSEALNDMRGCASARLCLGWAAVEAGDLEEALPLLEAAAEGQRDAGEPVEAAWTDAMCGLLRGHLGLLDDALAVCTEALRAAEDLGVHVVAARIAVLRAAVVGRLGDAEEARSEVMRVAALLPEALGLDDASALAEACAGTGPMPDSEARTEDAARQARFLLSMATAPASPRT